jgi:sugar phosphate isomerase/epimerase
MILSVSTANYYFLPFEQALEIIAGAGFEYVELDLYWARKAWAMAQHLKGYTARETICAIKRAGLKIGSIHDGGGVLEYPDSIEGFINPQLREMVDVVGEEMGSLPGCVVFHTPHIEGKYDDAWWAGMAGRIAAATAAYQTSGTLVTIENMPDLFPGYTVSMRTPEALLDFTSRYGLGITLDTTHYAMSGMSILDAGHLLAKKVNTVHLSDYAAPQAHVFIGDGDLDLQSFLGSLDRSVLYSITLECSGAHPGEDVMGLTQAEQIERLVVAKERVIW